MVTRNQVWPSESQLFTVHKDAHKNPRCSKKLVIWFKCWKWTIRFLHACNHPDRNPVTPNETSPLLHGKMYALLFHARLWEMCKDLAVCCPILHDEQSHKLFLCYVVLKIMLRKESKQDYFSWSICYSVAVAISYNINNFIQYNDLQRAAILKKIQYSVCFKIHKCILEVFLRK